MKMKIFLELLLVIALLPDFECLNFDSIQTQFKQYSPKLQGLIDQLKNLTTAPEDFFSKLKLPELKKLASEEPTKFQDLKRFVERRSNNEKLMLKIRLAEDTKNGTTTGAIIRQLNDRKGDTAYFTEIQEEFEKSKQPEDYSRNDVQNLDTALFELDAEFVARFTQEAKEEVLKRVNRYLKLQDNSRSKLKIKKAERLRKLIVPQMKKQSMLSELTNFEVVIFEELSAKQVSQLPITILNNNRMKNTIIESCNEDCSPDKKRAAVDLFIRKDKLKDITSPDTIVSIINQYGNLRDILVRDDVNPTAFAKQGTLRDVIIRNEEQQNKKGDYSSKTRKAGRRACSTYKKGLTYSERTILGDKVSMCSVGILKESIKKNAVSAGDVSVLVRGVKNEKGMSKKAKMYLFKELVRSTIDFSSNDLIIMGAYPSSVFKMMDNIVYNKVRTTQINPLLSQQDQIGLNNEQISILLTRAEGDYDTYNEQVRNLISSADAKKLGRLPLTKAAKGTELASPVSLMLNKKSESYLNLLDANNYNDYKNMLPNLDRKNAKKLKEAESEKVAKLINQREISSPFAQSLKDNYVAMKMKQIEKDGASGVSESEMINDYLDITDVSTLPPALFAKLGISKLEGLSDSNKKILLIRMCQTESASKGVSRSVLTHIIKIGLGAKRKLKVKSQQIKRIAVGLQPGSTVELGTCLPYVPPEEFEKASDEAAEEIVDALNKLAMEIPGGLCMNQQSMNAIGKLIIKGKGSPSTWADKDQVPSCLLHTMFSNDLGKIPEEILAETSCEKKPISPRAKDQEMGLCKNMKNNKGYDKMMEKAENKLRKAQVNANMQLSSSRRKRETATNALCERAQFKGELEVMTVSDLQGQTPQQVKDCKPFGYFDMPQNIADLLMGKIMKLSELELQSAIAEELYQYGCMIKGATRAQIQNMTAFEQEGFEAVISKLASCDWTSSQKREQFIKKLLAWKESSQLTANDIQNLGNILCFYPIEEIKQIPATAFRRSVFVFANNQNCPLPALQELANNKATDPSAFGKMKDWNAADVATLNMIMAGVLPENWKEISKDAIGGLTSGAMDKMPTDSIRSISKEQAEEMKSALVEAMPSEKRSALVKTQAHQDLAGGDDNSGSQNGVCILVTILMIASFYVTK